jgi:muramidase (phage lysozyme)
MSDGAENSSLGNTPTPPLSGNGAPENNTSAPSTGSNTQVGNTTSSPPAPAGATAGNTTNAASSDVNAQAGNTTAVPPVGGNAPASNATTAPAGGNTPTGTAASTDGATQKESDPNAVGFDLTFLDFAGKPIVGLQYKIRLMENGKWLPFPGTTDEKGAGARMSGMEPNSPLEVWVLKDDGTYARKYNGTVGCSDTSICLVSPHIKIKLKTEVHEGASGTPPAKPAPGDPSLEKKPNAPANAALPTGGKHADSTPTTGRDKDGHPIANLTDPSKDSSDRHRLPTLGLWTWGDFGSSSSGSTVPVKVPPPSAGKDEGAAKVTSIDAPPPEVVTGLIKIMEQQTAWNWRKLKQEWKTSAGVQAAIANKTFVYPEDAKEEEAAKDPKAAKAAKATKDAGTSVGQCYPSVKIGLWRAHYVQGVDGSTCPSTEAGPWLISQGFKNIMDKLPDARWAAPGDVIVYQYDDKTIAANNLAGNDNWGHIDVRSYDGYLSDFKKTTLPIPLLHGRTKGFVVNGIYRKTGMFDPLPELRMRAFLKVIREWECQSIPDEKRYFALQRKKGDKEQPYFSDTSTHPYADRPLESGSFAGAYQMRYATWNELVEKFGMPADFSPATQDRMAVVLIENRQDALGKIRKGEIREAITTTHLPSEWSSLPGGRDPRKDKTLDDVIETYNKFLKDLVNK